VDKVLISPPPGHCGKSAGPAWLDDESF